MTKKRVLYYFPPKTSPKSHSKEKVMEWGYSKSIEEIVRADYEDIQDR